MTTGNPSTARKSSSSSPAHIATFRQPGTTPPPPVPTWNYSAVHAKGQLSVLPALDAHTILNRSLAHYEPSLLKDRAIVTQAFQDTLSAAIVPIKIHITTLQGQAKLGQHKSPDAQRHVYTALQTNKHLDAQQLAAFMADWDIGTGNAPSSE